MASSSPSPAHQFVRLTRGPARQTLARRACRVYAAPVDGPEPRLATLMDVARLAGVHVSTVSRVLRDSPQLNIRPETRQRIKEAAEELGYRPNAVARSLRLNSTGTLGLLIPSLRNPVYAEI